METLILGIDLKRGDEVIVTDQNYPRMLTSWDQRARREGIVVKRISFKVPLASPGPFVERIRQAITPETRVIEFPHITNLTGQILPVREVVRLARERGIEVFVDGAHSFAHFPFTRDELGCDYFATSLHKWLLAPIGTGFLYVRKAKIKIDLAAHGRPVGQDREHPQVRGDRHPSGREPQRDRRGAGLPPEHRRRAQGRPAALPAQPMGQAAPAGQPRVKIWTPIDDDKASCGITLVDIEGIDPAKLGDHLFAQVQDPHRRDPPQGLLRHPGDPQRLHHPRGDRHLRRGDAPGRHQGDLLTVKPRETGWRPEGPSEPSPG